jgi:hypothetical protein
MFFQDYAAIAGIAGLVFAVVAQSAIIWRKLGNLEQAVKKAGCPFGPCPIFKRAQDEAALRSGTERSKV